MSAYDVVVIGSGFGGAVMACRLAQQGRKVLVLERGKRWLPTEYPSVTNSNWLWRENSPEKHHGWLDLRVFGDMSVAAGCGVGGGSLVYANVCVDAKPEAFNSGWPAEISAQELQPYYQRVEAMLKPAHLPRSQWTKRTWLMQEAAEKIGAAERFRTVPQAITFSTDWHDGLDNPYRPGHSQRWTNEFGQQQGTCVHCGNCDLGCAVQAKNTLDLNYIPLAEKHGAEVRALHHVRSIVPHSQRNRKDGAAGAGEGGLYRVCFRNLETGRDGFADARNVVLAAGSIGSTELLLKCRDRDRTLPDISAWLGKRWSANGDFVTPAYYHGREISPTRGPTISACIDFRDGEEKANGKRGVPVFIEDGGFPDLLGNALEQLSGGEWISRARMGVGSLTSAFAALLGVQTMSTGSGGKRDPLRHVMPWFGQGCDAASGELYLGRPWFAPWRRNVLKMRWDYQPNEAAMQAINQLHVQLAEATGGIPLTPPSWQIFRNLITPHPLGGCAMGSTIADGVVDHRGAVFGYPGLYVVDGAMVPAALGINPSKTIAALAERAAALMGE